jgi:hypothetical protein
LIKVFCWSFGAEKGVVMTVPDHSNPPKRLETARGVMAAESRAINEKARLLEQLKRNIDIHPERR